MYIPQMLPLCSTRFAAITPESHHSNERIVQENAKNEIVWRFGSLAQSPRHSRHRSCRLRLVRLCKRRRMLFKRTKSQRMENLGVRLSKRSYLHAHIGALLHFSGDSIMLKK